MLILPFIPSVPFYNFTTTISNVLYSFDVRWNSRAGQWYFDISEEDGTAIVRGVAITIGAALGKASTHPLLRSGIFIAKDTSQSRTTEATFDDLGTRVQVLYLTRADIYNEVVGTITGGGREPDPEAT